jgi:hypothetical protein
MSTVYTIKRRSVLKAKEQEILVCGLLAVGSRGEVGGGDGLGVCSGEGVCGGVVIVKISDIS